MASKGGTVCAYRGCTSRYNQKGISFFSFPKDPVRSEKWAKACNRGDLLVKNVDTRHRCYRVCEKHFEEKYITKGETRKTLFAQAVPLFSHTLKREQTGHEESAEANRKIIILSDIAIASPLKGPTSTECSSAIQDPTSTQYPETADGGSLDDLVFNSKIYSPLLSYSISTQTPATLSSGSPRKVKLRRKIKALRKARKGAPLKKRKLCLDDFNYLCDKFLNMALAEIIKAQAILKNRKPRGRRYSESYKQFALTLYFLGPRAYSFIGKLLCLPTERSLQKMTENLVCRPGLDNEPIFSALEVKVKTMLPQDKHCTLCIDEMALKSNLFYHTGRDEIVGLSDAGSDRKDISIAQNALVIMARGLYSNWKQPIAYCFTGSQVEAKKLHPLIEKCVSKLTDLGLHIDCLVSDMGSNFIELAKSLGVCPDNTEFEIAGTKMIYLFDPCHLLKATRNNLIKNVFCFDGKKTSWSYLEQFYQSDKLEFYRSAPKLTDSHIHPTNFEKMKVRLATQTLSNTVACGMNTHLSLGALPAEAAGTIEVIEKFNTLFDLLNSSYRNSRNKFKNVFKAADYQLDYLDEMVTFFEKLKIINGKGSDITSKCKSVKCWIITINGVKKLWEKLLLADFEYLQTRRVNSDCVENFFGSIRQQGGNSVNPTPIQFERAFRKLFCQNYLHSNNMNCVDDHDKLLMNLKAADVIVPERDDENSSKAISLPDYEYRKENTV